MNATPDKESTISEDAPMNLSFDDKIHEPGSAKTPPSCFSIDSLLEKKLETARHETDKAPQQQPSSFMKVLQQNVPAQWNGLFPPMFRLPNPVTMAQLAAVQSPWHMMASTQFNQQGHHSQSMGNPAMAAAAWMQGLATASGPSIQQKWTNLQGMMQIPASLPLKSVGTASLPGNDRRNSNQASAKPPALKKYKCDICSKAFSRSNTLVTHKRIHTGEKPFKCEHCGRAFRQPGNLTRHRLTHTTVKPYICSHCGKAFNRASNLHTHVRTHTNFRPYICSFCGKGFHQKIDMKIHSYTHTGERPYKCEICQKGFTLASTLNAHRRTHSEVKPFQCQHCHKTFYQKNSLKSHLLASHPFIDGKSLL